MGKIILTLQIVVIAATICGYVQACEEGSLAHNPNDCNSYIICLHGEEKIVNCPEGLQFNRKDKVCDWPENANCDTTSTAITETEQVTNAPEMAPIVTVPPPPPPPHGDAPKFPPYFDVMIKGPTLTNISAKTGQYDYTLAFVLGSSAGCVPKWGAEKELDDPQIISEIRGVQAKGGQVIVATGGAAGPYIEHSCKDKDSLVAAYKTILDKVGTNHLDIDVEAPIDIDMVTQALAQVQKERPSTTVSFTLMVQAEDYGLNPDLGIKVLEGAKKNGVSVHIVNPMTMEFGGPSADFGDSVIGAAESVLKQMQQIWPEKSEGELKRMLGVTPMLGRNFNGKVFETRHGHKLVNWANQNHIGLLAFWSVGRDNGNCPGGSISPSCSSTTQSEFEFTKIFQGFQG